MRGNKKYKFLLLALFGVVIVGLIVHFLRRHHLAVLDAKGPVAEKERNLFYFGLGLSALVVIPVYVLTIGILWKYRDSNPKPQRYRPDWDGSRILESLWWGIPCAIILVLSIVTWNSSQTLDPRKALASDRPALDVDVIALDWKWLFIYPKQNIASVNLVEMPVSTTVRFHITSDTVMNSFWIPNLGSQIYAMPGMETQLNLMASKSGSFAGSSANISGTGFSKMKFVARAGTPEEFRQWVNHAKQAPQILDATRYKQLAEPGDSAPVTYYSGIWSGLYTQTVLKYMAPISTSQDSAL